MVLTTYGRASGFCVDPIEKKPLNHFYPGHAASCRSARRAATWAASSARTGTSPSRARWTGSSGSATPEAIAAARAASWAARAWRSPTTIRSSSPSTRSTWPTPAARAGIKTVAVTAGYITPSRAREFYAEMDAANVDLKALHRGVLPAASRSRTSQPVLDTLRVAQARDRGLVRDHHPAHPRRTTTPTTELTRMCEWVARRARRRRAAALHGVPPRLQDDGRAAHAAARRCARARRHRPGARACSTCTPATCTTWRATPRSAPAAARRSSCGTGTSCWSTG